MKSKFISRGLPYLGGFFLQRLTSFALLPLFIVTMNSEDFSRFGLLVSAVTLLSAVMTLRVHVAPSRLIFDGEKENIASSVLVSSLYLSIFIFLISAAVLICITNVVHIDDALTRNSLSELFIIISIVFVRMISELFSLMMRAKGYANKFFLMALLEGVIVLVFLWSYYFDASDQYYIVLLSLLVSSIGSSLLGCYFMLELFKGGKNKTALYPEILHYSVPLGAYLVVNWVSVSSARWFGAQYVEMTELASYTVMAMIFVVVSMVVRVAFEVLRPELSKAFASGEIKIGDQLLSKSMKMAASLVLSIYLVIVVFFNFTSMLSIDGFSINNIPPFIYIVFAFVASFVDILYAKLVSRMVMLKQSYTLLMSGVISAALALCLNYFLITTMGVDGIAVALPLIIAVQILVLKGMDSIFHKEVCLG